MKNRICFIVFLLILFTGYAQGKFKIIDSSKKSVSVPFTMVHNLVIISAKVNRTELSFLLDTGVAKTIIFNVSYAKELGLNDVEKIKLRGLGEGEPLTALKSKNNLIELKGISNPSHTVLFITDNMFDLSSKMGMDIHGIIGGDLFKDFIVKIDYAKQKIIFYNPELFTYKACKKCETFPMEFFNEKPLLVVDVENHLGEVHQVKLLIDSGAGDALWLFENTHPKIKVPDSYFHDYLGKGLRGDIYGKRSKINKLKIGSFVFDNASVAYPDSTSTLTTRQNKERNGTLGAEVLKRFHVIYDYPNQKITFKKNSKHYKAPFLFNKSGIEIIYGGDMLIKESNTDYLNRGSKKNTANNIINIISSYGLVYKPSYEISSIRTGSPANLAGLMVGDIILEINGMTAYDKKMEEIILILSGKENKKIKLLVNRKGQHLEYVFSLKNML